MGSSPSTTESNAAAQAQAGANKVSSEMSPLVQGLTSGIPSGLNSSVFSYLLNPSGTNLAGAYPGLSSFYTNEMTQGLSPAFVNNALNNYQVQSQQGINSTVNSLGSALPNLAGSVSDMNLNSDEGRAQLLSNLAAQNQGVMQQGATGLQSAASGLDSQTMSMLTAALGGSQAASNSALSTYGNMFSQYNQSAQYDTAQAAQLQQQQSNEWASMLNGIMGLASTGLTGGLNLGSLFGGGTSLGPNIISPYTGPYAGPGNYTP